MDNEKIRIEELSINNAVLIDRKICLVNTIENNKSIFCYPNGAMFEWLNKDIEPLPLTKEILKNNLGFEVTDMGDFWQAEKGDFVLIQIKISIGSMPFMFVIKSSIKESVNFYYVHHLQNTYLDLKGELLVWKG